MVDLFRLIASALHSPAIPRKGIDMCAQVSLDLAAKYRRAPKAHAQGKTKTVWPILGNEDTLVALVSSDDITADDGARRDTLPGKGMLANQTTCNVFRLLQACDIPVAFAEQDSPDSFVAPWCRMFPYEVVVRREAHGSYCKRNPHIPKGHIFPKLVVEFFLKTSGRRWKQYELPCDDPLLVFESVLKGVLFNPVKPIHGQEPFLVLDTQEIFTTLGESQQLEKMAHIATQAFLVLEKAWQLLGRRLVDFKVEFGLDDRKNLLLADVIDNDSWRVLDGDGTHLDKQIYRDRGELDKVFGKYKQVAEMTNRFGLPQQRIILWRGSESDNLAPIMDALAGYKVFPNLSAATFTQVITCSAHKEPVRAVGMLTRALQQVPDSVVIALVGLSNAAGPMLSAASTTPVITVPAVVGEFSSDVWSSLRMPRDVPVMTVLSPTNAALAAVNILAARNPLLYMLLRKRLEERLVNTVLI